MSNSLRGKRISETYQKLVQIISGQLYDGSGNLLPFGASGIGFQGPQGNAGLQGTTGVRGVSGGTGSQGFQGWQGNEGYGFQGFQGLNGLQGFQGFSIEGFQGWQGNEGFQGWQGPIGLDGFQGPIGLSGIDGFQGLIGPEGNIGFQGPIGLDGFQGPIGLSGIDGFQGFQGPIGIENNISINQINGNYTLALSDNNKMLIVEGESLITIPSDTVTLFNTGSQILILRNGIDEVGVTSSGDVTLNSAQGYLSLNFQYSAMTLVKISPYTWCAFGDLKI